MTFDLATLRQRQSDARARALAARSAKTDLLSQLNAAGRAIAEAEIDEAKAKQQAKAAREEEQRQERLRAAQRAYLEQQGQDFDTTSFESYEWFDGIFTWQLEAIQFGAAAKRFVLGDEPGLGKTRSAIGWLDAVSARKAILIAPGEVAEQFAAEIEMLAEHRTVIDFRSVAPAIRKQRQERLLRSDEAVAVLNYEAMRNSSTNLMADLLAWRADSLIVDEAHLIRNTETALYKHVEKLVGTDTYCGACHREVACLLRQEYNERGKKKGPAVKVPCPHCGWKKGQAVEGVRYERKIDEYLATKSIQNVAFLTGTPILNAPEELYAIFHLARPDLFPRLDLFRKTFTYADAAGHRYFTAKGLENLREMIKPLYLARRKSEVTLPDGRTLEETIPQREIIDIMVPIEYDEYPQQRTVIDQIRKFSQIQLASGQVLPIMEQLAQITRQRQANVFPGGIEVTEIDPDTGEKRVVFTTADDIDEAAKMDEILVRSGDHEGERQVVFSQFSTALVELEERYQEAGYRVVRLDGSTPKSLRTQIKSNFYKAKGEKPKWDVVLVNYKTGGAGLNLTACTVTHLMDSEWNPGNEDQALHRTYRIGQDEETTVYRYLTPATIDIRIEAIKRRKRKLVEAFERGEIETLTFNKAREIAEALAS